MDAKDIEFLPNNRLHDPIANAIQICVSRKEINLCYHKDNGISTSKITYACQETSIEVNYVNQFHYQRFLMTEVRQLLP